jgi:site-specific DNA recombinase
MQATAATRCAIYTRVSTEEQAREGYSLPAQEERLRAHAKSQGWAVYKLYMDDGYSAGSRNRPALKRLLAEAALKRFDVVLAYKIDRLSRSLKDLIDIVAELNQFDVGFKSCTELIDTTRPEGRLMFHQFGSFAQYERELIGQRTRFGMMKRLRQGLWNGIPPYGYRIVERKLVIEPAEAARVRGIFDWYLGKNLGVVAISRELNRLGITPRKAKRWKGNTIYKLIQNPLYAGFIRWGGETAMGTHEPIIRKEVFDAAQKTLRERNHKTRQLRSPNYLAGLVKCGLCGAAMHVTYPGTETKSRFKYYVCNNRYNHKSCTQEYIRADILEASVIQEIGKLAERKDIISALVEDYVEHKRKSLPELEQKREAIRQEIASLGPEKQKLSRWLRGSELTPQAARFVNAQIDELCEQETRLQEQQWALEDQINELQKDSYNAEAIASHLKEFVLTFPQLQAGERKLLVDSLIERVEIGQTKRVVAVLRPPLSSFGYFSPSLAPKEEKRKVSELIIYLAYDLAAYYGTNAHSTTRVGAGFSGREYMLKSPEPSAQAVRACAILRGFATPTVQTAEAVCATAQSL